VGVSVGWGISVPGEQAVKINTEMRRLIFLSIFTFRMDIFYQPYLIKPDPGRGSFSRFQEATWNPAAWNKPA
jgi:hypothetical protein